jgi:RNA polymerase sigma factor (sigma-70 family)
MSKLSKYSDNELFVALKSEDKSVVESAFAEVYSRYSQRVYAYCLRVSGNEEDARDIFQEAFLKFYNSLVNVTQLDNLMGYLIKISRNLCLNHRRNKKTTVDFEDMNFFSNDEKYEDKELLNLIAASLELLDIKHREAFVLRQYQGMTYKEIQSITGDSISAIKNRVWRAKEKIKEILSPYLEDLS